MKSYLGKGKEKDVKGGEDSWERKNMWGIKSTMFEGSETGRNSMF